MVHFERQHFLRVFEHARAVIRVLRLVDEFVRVVAQVEKQGRQRAEVHVLVVLVADHRQAALVQGKAEMTLQRIVAHVAKIALPEGFLAPAARHAPGLQRRQQRKAVALTRDFETEPVEHGRHEVDVFGEVVENPAAAGVGFVARVAHDQRDVVGLIVETELRHQPVIAELLAVIGGENDQRLLPVAAFFQHLEQAAEVIVDLADQAEIIDHVLLGLADRIRRAKAAVVDEKLHQRMQMHLVGGIPAPRWQRHVGGIVEGIVGFGCSEGRMRAQ